MGVQVIVMCDRPDVEYRLFVVGERPYCVWDTAIQETTLHYLDSIDAGYFEYMAETHARAAVEEKSQAAAIALRAAYSQGLETLFALIGASLQAPLCVPSWMVMYRNLELQDLVTKISTEQPIVSLTGRERLSWLYVSSGLLENLQIDD